MYQCIAVTLEFGQIKQIWSTMIDVLWNMAIISIWMQHRCNSSDWGEGVQLHHWCDCLGRIRGVEEEHDVLVAQNQPKSKDLNRAQCGHYWIMRALQAHSAHFTSHLGIIGAWKEYAEVTAHSSIKIFCGKYHQFWQVHSSSFISIFLLQC